jgi:hypothetical protein
MAAFVDIRDTLAAKGLQLPTLNVLEPNSELCDVFAIQPTGAVAISPDLEHPDFVGNADRDLAIAKYTAFIKLGRELNSDLVLSPEYSFPWEVLRKAIIDSILPEAGRLWIFGCEAITRKRLLETITNHPQVEWVSEPIPNGPGRFLNTLVYVTRTLTVAGDQRWLVLLQFKHEPLGGNTFERDHLIRGHVVHILRNPQENIRLISLICSDALTFHPDTAGACRFDRDPYIIFHPQLNPNPLQVDFSNYRGNLFGRNTDRFEVITLNWAREFSFPDGATSSYGGSTLYTKSPNFGFPDARIEHNHHKGLYFVYWDARRTQLFLFNFEEHLFRFRIPKVVQVVPAVEAARTGPEMTGIWGWDATTANWRERGAANDGFDLLCESFENPECNYCTIPEYTVVDRERLFMLSTGTLLIPHEQAGWYHVTNLDCFKAETDERSKRLTFTQENSVPSVSYRHDHLGRFVTLQSAILTEGTSYPPNIADLKADWKVVPPRQATNFRFNLESLSGTKAPATGVFVGSVPPGHATRVRDDIIRMWGGIEHARRLVVWYQDPQAAFKSVQSPLPTFMDDSEPPTSYSKGE